MDFSRQLNSLHVQSNEIRKEDGVFSNGMFYQKLNDFIKFYDEIRFQLEAQPEYDNPLLIDKIKSLPELTFKDYDNPFSAKTILYIIGYTIFFPIGIAYFFNKYNYVSDTKAKLAEISSSVSSIEFLTRGN